MSKCKNYDNNNLKFQFSPVKVGWKTSIACAIAVKLADQGKVLLISTDPASNLSDRYRGIRFNFSSSKLKSICG
jgi:hypothetical protein